MPPRRRNRRRRVWTKFKCDSPALPIHLYCGTADPFFRHAESASRRLPHASFIALPGYSHMDAFYRSEDILPGVMEFLASR